jgi:hypothetical protein
MEISITQGHILVEMTTSLLNCYTNLKYYGVVMSKVTSMHVSTVTHTPFSYPLHVDMKKNEGRFNL